MSVKEFIDSNYNKNVKWKINDVLFTKNKFIPNDILEKYIIQWKVNQGEGIIEIITY